MERHVIQDVVSNLFLRTIKSAKMALLWEKIYAPAMGSDTFHGEGDMSRQQWVRTLFTLDAIVTKLAYFFNKAAAPAELASLRQSSGRL